MVANAEAYEVQTNGPVCAAETTTLVTQYTSF